MNAIRDFDVDIDSLSTAIMTSSDDLDSSAKKLDAITQRTMSSEMKGFEDDVKQHADGKSGGGSGSGSGSGSSSGSSESSSRGGRQGGNGGGAAKGGGTKTGKKTQQKQKKK